MLLASLLFAFLPAASPVNFRCVVPGPPAIELTRSVAVFTGKVVGRKYIDDTIPEFNVSGRRLVVLMKVDRVWKGDINEDVVIYKQEVIQENGLTWNAGEDFHQLDNKQYLIYAYGTIDKLSVSGCSRSRDLGKADDDLKELGEGYKPKSSLPY